MTAIGFQLYSLHAVDDPLSTVIERVGETGFDGVEFAGLDGASVDDLSAALDRAGLDAAGAHVGLDEIESDPDGVAETYSELGCETVAVPWLDPDNFESAGAVDDAADRLDAAAAALADRGLDLHYHNHDQEFADLDGAPAIERLIERTDRVGFQVDLGWVGAAGSDPLDFLDAHADRVELVHLKDYDADAGDVVEVGEGDLDVARTVEAVRGMDADWLTYEAEDRPDSYATLDHADDVVAAYW
ncbi:sugar phosphate isomerase/epimerase family protein [Candidatus Halobonum tyrrellensis]|uniref:Xylose isomerase domain protein TIM barrel n=1 Tax=Candidatus Halobonum tyrrellensis G22 TaxID=1324957 RepID=V4HA80_9EURY|nr:sugar phosphate isomerase/epimerase [Candidatus Halobonum tyrrellensis]ESP86958.1 Xylose isomerase domain protein TIM barrel [Candidatus Halobonum tyrrellensis G22]